MARGRKPYVPTDKERALVRWAVACGTTQEHIATLLGISVDTLSRRFKSELATGKVEANLKLARVLYSLAEEGNVTALIFWLKTQGRWSEVNQLDINANVDMKIDVGALSDEELEKLAKG